MKLTGLHFLLTYRCNRSCEHCFVWGGPWQRGSMTEAQVKDILIQARDAGSIESVWFEGGEPFLHPATLATGCRAAKALGFWTGIVSNGFWTRDDREAVTALDPLRGLVDKLAMSADEWHWGPRWQDRVAVAERAAAAAEIPLAVFTIAASPAGRAGAPLPGIMYRGRAARALAADAPGLPWESFTRCPHEKLDAPGRVHVDPLGFLHLCQGLTMGNVFAEPLAAWCDSYDPATHPIAGPLLAGGPAELIRRTGVPHRETYADACHACYDAREALRPRYPSVLAPAQMYGPAA